MTGNPAAPGSGVHTFRTRQSSPVVVSQADRTLSGAATCGGSAPSRVASRTPPHGCTGCGGRSRFAPNGGAA